MSLNLKRVNRGVAVAVTLDEIKHHLKLPTDSTEEDYDLLGFIESATDRAETLLRQKLLTQSWDWYVDALCDSYLIAPIGPLLTVTSFSYYDSANVLTVWDAANYWVDAGALRARITPRSSVSWPTLYDRPQAVQIRLSVGYGTREAIPWAIRNWIKCEAGTMHINRETVAEKAMIRIGSLDGLLDQYRVKEI